MLVAVVLLAVLPLFAALSGSGGSRLAASRALRPAPHRNNSRKSLSLQFRILRSDPTQG
jgi:hypothetical protein